MLELALPQPLYDPVHTRARVIALLIASPSGKTMPEIVYKLRGRRAKGVTVAHLLTYLRARTLLAELELDGVIECEGTWHVPTYFITGRVPVRYGTTVPAESVRAPVMRQNTWYGALGFDAA